MTEIGKEGKAVKKFYGDGAYGTNLVFSSLKDAERALEEKTSQRIVLTAVGGEGTRSGGIIPSATRGVWMRGTMRYINGRGLPLSDEEEVRRGFYS